MKNIFLIVLALTTFGFASCRKECSINDVYQKYNCPTDFNLINNYVCFKDLYFTSDSCSQTFENIGYSNEGCAKIINDSSTYAQWIKKSGYLLDSIDLENKTFLGISCGTDLGLSIVSKEFICVNNLTKKYIFRFQYELTNQCAGSRIRKLTINFGVLIPKIPDDYDIEFSVENMNPFHY